MYKDYWVIYAFHILILYIHYSTKNMDINLNLIWTV